MQAVKVNRQKREEKVDPSVVSSAYAAMVNRWQLINDVLAGTEILRKRGQMYLPKHPEETDDSWKRRLNQAVLVNMTSQTLETLVGKPFSDPLVLEDDVPDQIKELTKDVDLQGNHLDIFCRQWFREALAKGFSHVLVEFPEVAQPEDGTKRTLDDDRKDGLRPYWLRISPEDLIAAYAEVVNGEEILTHVRFRETTIERVGFEEIEIERIHVREPGIWQIWKKEKIGSKEVWKKEKEGTSTLPFIPMTTFYASRDGFMISKPPLMDLAYMNIAHWQSYSDQRNILSVARFPMLAASGVEDDAGTVKVGPNQIQTTADPNARYYYVEHTGKAIEAGRNDLKDIEDHMASYGADFLRKRPTFQTATGRVLDQVDTLSPLQAMTLSFEDALENVLQDTAAWLKLEDGGCVKVKSDFGVTGYESADLSTLEQARKRRDISRKAYLAELRRRGTLSDDYNADEDFAEIESEIMNLPELPNTEVNDPANPAPHPQRTPA